MSQKRTRTNNGSRDEDGNLVQTTPLYHPTTYSNKRFLKLGPNVISVPQAWNGANPQTNISQVGFNQSTITHYDPSNLPNMIGSYYGFSLDTNGVLDVSQNIAIPVSEFNPATGSIIKRFLGVDNIDVTKTTGNAGGGGLDWPSGENSASYNLQKANITGSSLIRTNAIEQRQSYVIRNATQTGLIGRVKQHYPKNWVAGRGYESSDQLNYNPYLSMEVGSTTTELDKSNDGRPPTDYFGNPELGDGDLTCGNILDGEIMGFKMSGVSWNADPSANNYIAAVYDTSGAGVVINYYGSYWLFRQNFSLNSSKYLSHPYHSKVENFRDSSNIGYTMCGKYNEEDYAKKREEERALPSPWLPLFGHATLDQQYEGQFPLANKFYNDGSLVLLNDQHRVDQYPIEMDRRGGPYALGNPGALTYRGHGSAYIYTLDAQYHYPILSRGSQKLVFSTGIYTQEWDQHYPWDYGTEDMSYQLTFENIYDISANLDAFDSAFETRQNEYHDLFPTRAGYGFDETAKAYGFVDKLYPFDCSANNFCNRAALSNPDYQLNKGFPVNNAETAPGPNAVHFQSNFRRMNATGMVMNKTGRTFVSYGHANPSELGGSSIWYYDPSYADILLPTKLVTNSETQVFSAATIDETTLYNWRSGITFDDQIVGTYYPSWFSIEDTYNPASGETTITQTTSSHLVGSIPIDESPNAIISATNGNINSIVLVEEGNVEFLYALDISNNQIIKKNVTDLTGSASTWATLDTLSNASNGNSYYGLAYNQAFDPTSSETSKKYMFYLSVTGVIANGGLDTRTSEIQATGMVLPAQESDGDGYIMGLAANSSYEYVSSSSGNILGDGTNNNLFRPGYMCTDGSGSLVVMVDNNRASGGYIDQPSSYQIWSDDPLLADFSLDLRNIKVRHEQGGKPRVPGNMYRLTAPSGTNNFNKYPDNNGNSQQLDHYSSSIFQPATFDFSTNDLGNYQDQLDVSRFSDPNDPQVGSIFEGSYNAWIEDLRNVQFQSYRKNGGYMVPAQPVWISTSESTFLLPHSIDEYLSPTTEPSLNTYLNLTAFDAITNHLTKVDEYEKIYSKMRQIQTYELSHDSNKYTTAAAATAAGYQLVTIPQTITNPANDVTSTIDLSQVALYNVSTGDYGTYDNRKVVQSDNTINPTYATFVNKLDTLLGYIGEVNVARKAEINAFTAGGENNDDPAYQAAGVVVSSKQLLADNAATDLILNHQFDPSRNPPCGFFSGGGGSAYAINAPVPASFEFLGQLYEFNEFTGANNLEGFKWSEQLAGGTTYNAYTYLNRVNADVILNRETAYRRAAARAYYESLTDASFIAGSLAENSEIYTNMIDDIYNKFDVYEAESRLLTLYLGDLESYTQEQIDAQRVVVNDASAACIAPIDKAILLTGTSNVQEYAGNGLSSEFIFYNSSEYGYGPNDWSANNGNQTSYTDLVTGQTITFDIAYYDFDNGELNLLVRIRHKALEPPPINYNDPAANPNTRDQYAAFNVLYAAYLEMDVNALLDPLWNIPTYELTGAQDSQGRAAYRIVEDPSGFTIANFNNTEIGDLISNSDSNLALYSSTSFDDHDDDNWNGSANPFTSSNWGSSLEAAYNTLINAIKANPESSVGAEDGFVVVENNPAILLTAETHPLIMPLNYLYQYINNTFDSEAETADANLKRKNEKCWSLFNYSIYRGKQDLVAGSEGSTLPFLYGMGPYMLGGPDMGQGDLGINNDYSALQTTTAAAEQGFSFDWVSTLGYNSNDGLPVNDVQQIEIRYGNNMNPEISFFTYWDGQGYPMTGPQNQYISYNNVNFAPAGIGSSGYYWSFDINGNRGNEAVLENGYPVLDPDNYYYPVVTKTSRSGSGGNQVLYYKHIDSSGNRVSGRKADGSLVESPRIAQLSDVGGSYIRDLIGHEDGSYFPSVLASKSYFTYVNTGPVNDATDANNLGLNANPNFNPSWGTQDASYAGINYPNGMIAMQEDAATGFQGNEGGGFDDPFGQPNWEEDPPVFPTNKMTLLERNRAILAYNQHVSSSNPIRTNKFVGGVEPLAPNLSVDGTSLPMGIPRRAIGSTDARYFSYYSVDKTRTAPAALVDRPNMGLQVTNEQYRNDFTTYGYNYQNARPQNYWPWNTLLIRNRHQRASLGCAMDFCTPFVFDVSYSSQEPAAIHSINYPPPVLNNTTINATDLAAQPASGAWVINNPDISANYSDGTDNNPMPFTPYVFNYQNQGYISTVFDSSYIDSTSGDLITNTKEIGGVNRFVNVKGVSDPSFISSGTISVACLAEGTNIDCYMERIKVEDLQVGDMVRTYKHGHKKVVHIEKTDMNDQVMNFRLDCLFRAKKEDLPALSEDLYVTGGHSILLDSLSQIEQWHMKSISWPGHFFQVDGKYKLLAAHSEKFQITNKKVKVYNIILEQDDENDMYVSYGIYANGLLVETCNKGSLLHIFEKKKTESEIKADLDLETKSVLEITEKVK